MLDSRIAWTLAVALSGCVGQAPWESKGARAEEDGWNWGDGDGDSDSDSDSDADSDGDADMCEYYPGMICCAGGQACPEDLVCDGIVCASLDCEVGDWTCNDGHCIDGFRLCDGTVDCRDGSDEGTAYGPGGRGCFDGRGGFFCGGVDDFSMVDELVCDGCEDCLNGADEDGCGEVSGSQCDTSSDDEYGNGDDGDDCFYCDEGSWCIPPEWVCDCMADCSDGTDEEGCEPC